MSDVRKLSPVTPTPTGKDRNMTATTANRGCLPAGTVTEFGTILETSYTAYLVTSTTGIPRWVSFDQVHGRPSPVTPLVTLGSW